jgi:serine/threonine-protein kinase
VPDLLERLNATLGERYQIQRELGRGGMATVFLATDLKHDRQVAIKVLHPELAAALGPERFDREIRFAAKLQHPNILGLFDSGQVDGLLYYVMPFVQGESLRGRLDREQLLPIDAALRIAHEVADALGYAHMLGIIHRDIKPENIMLSGGHALVADFGIARAVSEAGSNEKLTETGVAIGTPLYMSPEQAAGDPVNATSDIYSLACVLYEMLAGHPPFGGTNSRQIMARHAVEQVPSLQVVRDTVPDEVEDAVLSALSKVPADRPQTAAAFAEMLGDVPSTSGPRYSVSRARLSRQVTRAHAAQPGAVTLTVRRRSLVGAALAAVVVLGAAGVAWYLTRGRPVTTGAGGPDRRSIAVLYFEDQSPKHELGYLADGLTEELIATLRGVRGLTVVSKGGVAPFREAKVTRDSIARALQVGTLVTGSVEPELDSIRVTVRLLDDAGTELDKATFMKSAKDVVGLTQSLGDEAANQIRKRIGEEVRLVRTRAATSSTDAWAMYQRAVQARDRGDALSGAGNDSGFAREYLTADSLAATAAGLDAQWAAPILLRGRLAYWRSRRALDDPGLANRMLETGLAQAERALALDKNDPDALALRGDLKYWRWLYPLEPDSARRRTLLLGAQEDLEAAVRTDPGNAAAHATLSHMYYNVSGKTGLDVVLEARQALAYDAYLSNADVVINRLTLGYYDLGQFPEADKWCREGRRRFPTAPRFGYCQLLLMISKFAEPHPDSAWRLADSVVRLTQDPQDRRYAELSGRVLAAGVLARAGLRDSARAVLHATKDDPEIDPSHDLANLAGFVWTLVGDTTEALNQLKAYLLANPGRVATYRDDPGWWYQGLSRDPRYQALLGAR